MRCHVVLAMLAAAGCGTATDEPVAGELVMTWTSASPGSDRMPAQLTLCARDSVVELLASRVERGVGFSVHLAAPQLAAGRFPVLSPETDPLPRPAAAGVFRALESELVRGWLSQDGEFEVTEIGAAGISGRFSIRFVDRGGTDSMSVQGTFQRLPLSPAPEPCGIAPRAPVAVILQ